MFSLLLSPGPAQSNNFTQSLKICVGLNACNWVQIYRGAGTKVRWKFCKFICKLSLWLHPRYWTTTKRLLGVADHSTTEWSSLEGTIKIIHFQLPLLGNGHLPLDQGAQIPSNLALNMSRDGTSTTSHGNQSQCLTTLTEGHRQTIQRAILLSLR